jgi:hypothetical protein
MGGHRASDTKLKRQVAVKILPPALAADPDRLACRVYLAQGFSLNVSRSLLALHI